MQSKKRPGRIRGSEPLRRLGNETPLNRNDLIQPLFVVPGTLRHEPIDSLPGVARFSVDLLADRVEDVKVPAVLVFGVPDPGIRNPDASEALHPDGLVPRRSKS